MKLVDILVLGTSAEKRVGSNPTEGKFFKKKTKNFETQNNGLFTQ